MLVELLVALIFVSVAFFVLWEAFDLVLENMTDLDRKEASYQRIFAGLEELTAGEEPQDSEDLKITRSGDLWTLSSERADDSSSELSRTISPDGVRGLSAQ